MTQVLRAIDAGDATAAADLLPLVYAELRKLAARPMAKESPGHTFTPTALVNDAYVRLVGNDDPGWQNRGHFFAAAAEAMRRILVEGARRKAVAKHGGGGNREPLDDGQLEAVVSDRVDLLALDEALAKLRAEDPAKGKLVELRYFAGMSTEEAACVLGISRATAARWWAYARAFLFCELGGHAGPG